jgi:general secretion pathway protein M
MKTQFLTWWRERSLREQRLLLVMGALLAVTILWLGIYRPLQNGLSAARERHQEAVVRLGEVKGQAEALRSLRGSGSRGADGPFAAIVTASAGEAGFANATVAPQGDGRATVSIPSARPAPLLRWLAEIEAGGAIVERMSARANTDQTLAVDMTLGRAR